MGRTRRYFGVRLLLFSCVALLFFLGQFNNVASAGNLGSLWKPSSLLLVYFIAFRCSKAVLFLITFRFRPFGSIIVLILYSLALLTGMLIAANSHQLFTGDWSQGLVSVVGGGFFLILSLGCVLGLVWDNLGPFAINAIDQEKILLVEQQTRQR